MDKIKKDLQALLDGINYINTEESSNYVIDKQDITLLKNIIKKLSDSNDVKILYKNKTSGNFYYKHHDCINDISKLCDCGNIKKNYYSYCETCLKKNEDKRIEKQILSYSKLEYKEWDEESPLYDENVNEWFNLKEDVINYYIENEYLIKDVRLRISEPNYLSTIETEYWQDNVHDEFDFEDMPTKFDEALNKLNEICNKTIGCYDINKYRTSI